MSLTFNHLTHKKTKTVQENTKNIKLQNLCMIEEDWKKIKTAIKKVGIH